MKKIFTLIFLFLVMGLPQAYSHALWLETSPIGKIGEEQLIKVYFGEYSYNLIETVGNEAFEKVAKFNVWLTTPSGKKIELKAAPKESYFLIKYTPTENGVFTIELQNNAIDVIDYTKYNFGIFKTHYHSTAKFVVGSALNDTKHVENNGLYLQDISHQNDSLNLRIFYHGEIMKDAEVVITVKDNWSKTCMTDENGEISLALPWKMNYFIEVTHKEEVPGEYNGIPYEFIWHCATYMVSL